MELDEVKEFYTEERSVPQRTGVGAGIRLL
jgi:hypothetical protein